RNTSPKAQPSSHGALGGNCARRRLHPPPRNYRRNPAGLNGRAPFRFLFSRATQAGRRGSELCDGTTTLRRKFVGGESPRDPLDHREPRTKVSEETVGQRSRDRRHPLAASEPVEIVADFIERLCSG